MGGETEGDPLMLAAEVVAPSERPEDGLTFGLREQEPTGAMADADSAADADASDGAGEPREPADA